MEGAVQRANVVSREVAELLGKKVASIVPSPRVMSSSTIHDTIPKAMASLTKNDLEDHLKYSKQVEDFYYEQQQQQHHNLQFDCNCSDNNDNDDDDDNDEHLDGDYEGSEDYSYNYPDVMEQEASWSNDVRRLVVSREFTSITSHFVF